ncbi:hypothetical protein D3C85_1369530 [compost metagenome]
MGIICNCSKFCAQTPMMKPNRLKVVAIRIRKASIQKGCNICKGTNRAAVARMIRPSTADLVAAAPT